tara:strand:- start:1597 stop:2208 length:612 start_codon:yes stop_codon:yes gene_type:complete
MRKTPQHFKRLETKKVIEEILQKNKTSLSPLAIITSENLNENFTTTSFSFLESLDGEESQVNIENKRGKGFIDGLFTGLHEHYSQSYESLKDIKLVNLKVNPVLSAARNSIGTDAQASVLFSLHIKNHGISEFHHKSRSMIHSSFNLALEAFQFYINCERVFDKIQILIAEAQSRNRGDIVSDYIYKLSKITEVNSYEKRREG